MSNEYIKREDAIEVARTYVIDKCPKYMKEWADKLKAAVIEDFCDDIMALPAAPVREVVLCQECKFFERDAWRTVNGIPLIVAHDICRFWAGGCKTTPDGYCARGERADMRPEEGETT